MVFVAGVWALGVHAVRAYWETLKLEQTLSPHFSEQVVRELRSRPEILQTFGEERKVSFLFTDIKDFAKASERNPASILFHGLTDYFNVAVPCIRETEGTVMQFVGDAIYAIWNAPLTQPDHASRTERSALRMRDRLEDFQADDIDEEFITRIGIHAGEAMVGNCGAEDRFEYAAIGKDTNFAARMEGLNNYFGTRILASAELFAEVKEEVARQATTERFVFRFLGKFSPKGIDRFIGLYEVIGDDSCRESVAPWLRQFEAAREHFNRQEWDAAEAGFRATLKLKQNDGPSEYLLKRIDHLRRHPPGAQWMGELTLDEK